MSILHGNCDRPSYEYSSKEQNIIIISLHTAVKLKQLKQLQKSDVGVIFDPSKSLWG